MPTIGGSTFINNGIDLLLIDRCVKIHSMDPLTLSVVLISDDKAYFEIKNNQPVDNPITKYEQQQNGYVVFSDKQTGNFIYKLRPDSETSIILGTMRSEDITISIRDTTIKVNNSTFEDITAYQNGVGMIVGKDGGIGIGAAIPHNVSQALMNIQN